LAEATPPPKSPSELPKRDAKKDLWDNFPIRVEEPTLRESNECEEADGLRHSDAGEFNEAASPSPWSWPPPEAMDEAGCSAEREVLAFDADATDTETEDDP
jgi:hypothetical protein